MVIREAYLDLSEYFDPNRRQYNGDKLLKVVDSMVGSGPYRTVGLFNVDLFIPILTYIFGQAQLGGRTAIASVYRLSSERYGMKAVENDVLERYTKVVIHELGHIFGLVHCYDSHCVMRSGTYVEDIDQKEAHLCLKCRAALSRFRSSPSV